MTTPDGYTPIREDQEEAYRDWIKQARSAAIRIARESGKVTIDDVRAVCPPPDKADPRVMGAIFHPRKLWTVVGYIKSGRRENHGRPIPEWTYQGPDG